MIIRERKERGRQKREHAPTITERGLVCLYYCWPIVYIITDLKTWFSFVIGSIEPIAVVLQHPFKLEHIYYSSQYLNNS